MLTVLLDQYTVLLLLLLLPTTTYYYYLTAVIEYLIILLYLYVRLGLRALVRLTIVYNIPCYKRNYPGYYNSILQPSHTASHTAYMILQRHIYTTASHKCNVKTLQCA